jgi:hypothetical protein
MRFVPAFILLALLCGHVRAGSGFDLSLRVDAESARSTIDLFEGLSGTPSSIARLRGSQIALATTALLAQKPLGTKTLEDALQSVKFNQRIEDDVFLMQQGKEHRRELQDLLDAVIRRNFGQKVVSTVEQLFPPDTRIQSVLPVYFVAFGHENIDAFVRRVTWSGDVPSFVGEGQGELTIVVNLSKAVGYGRTLDERFIGLLSVVAHEVFHAAFGVYKDGSSDWRRYYTARRGYLDQLLDLTQNEGIAHYLSLIQRTGGKLRQDQVQKVHAAFAEFNRTADELASRGISPRRAGDLIRNSNTSGYWESYGAITGMIVARQIDQTLGRQALMETIAKGPDDFFGKYAEVAEKDDTFPKLGKTVLKEVGVD